MSYGLLRRMVAVVLWAAVAVPILVVALWNILRWAGHWLLTGEDADERLLLTRTLCWLLDLPARATGRSVPGMRKSPGCGPGL